MMMVVPAVLIVVAWLIHRSKYTLDEATHARIVHDLAERGQVKG